MPKLKKSSRSVFKRFSKRPLLIVGVALVLLVGGGIAYAQFKDSQSPGADSSESQSGDYINLNPPTDQEKQQADKNKKSLAEEPSPPPPTSNGKKQVTPQIISASLSEVRAYVEGVFEDGGTCTATATSGTQTKTATSKGFKNVSYTQCEPIGWSLLSGSWSVVVSYSSSNAQGNSEAYQVN